MSQKELTNRFFKFETESNVFEIKDAKGNPLWDIIRADVYFTIMRHYAPVHQSENHSLFADSIKVNSLLFHIHRIWCAFIYFLFHWNKKYLIILCSRNVKDGKSFDKIADSLMEYVNSKHAYLVETYLNFVDNNYKYGNASTSIVDILRYIYANKFDSSKIVPILRKEFPDVHWDVDVMRNAYGRFYAQYYYYRFLIRTKKIKKCFLVQNRYHNGLYLAAKELGVSVVELQHGEITRNHIVYSYPESLQNDDNIYTPAAVLTFGDFWLKDCNYPCVDIKSIGNHFYHLPRITANNEKTKDVLVVSDSGSCMFLEQLVKEIIDNNPNNRIHFYFKLHPNQSADYRKFKESFNNYPQIEVIPSNRMISEFIRKVAFVLAVESTVEFEALSVGVKVIIYKRGGYQYLDAIFKENGVFLIDNTVEFMDVYNNHINDTVKDYASYFFKDFDLKVLKEYL